MSLVSWCTSGYPRASSLSRRSVIWPRRSAGISLAIARGRALESCLGGGEPCHRHSIRGGRDVRQPKLVAERDRRWLAGVLAADADLQAGLRLAATFDRHAHHRADAVPIEDLERVRRDDLLLDIPREEALLRVVA